MAHAIGTTTLKVLSTRVIANGDGSFISWEAAYRPYGQDNVISNNDGLDVFYLATGYELDYEMNPDADYYANLRYMSASLGRFFQPDPVGGDPTNPQSWNRYAYALNNPTNLIDPLGLADCPFTFCIVVTAAPLDPFTSDPFFLCGLYGFCGAGRPEPLNPGEGPNRSGNGQPKQKPQPKPKSTPERIDCANNFANNHSLAALFGAQNTLIGKALGGNAIAGAGELYLAVAAKEGTNPVALGGGIAVGGAGLGISPVGSPGIKGAAGILQDAVVKGTVTAANNALRGVGSTPITVFTAESTLATEEAVQLSTETLEHVATGVGTAKLILDAGIYFYGLSQCR